MGIGLSQALAGFFAQNSIIEALEAEAERLRRGESHPDRFRAARLDQGIYLMRGEPEEGGHIVRIKLPQGDVEAGQLRVVADLAEEFGGVAHVTTRQGVELHGPRLAELGTVLRRLAAAGLTTRESAGNTVRNVTCCPLAGVCAQEPFDVTPYARALSRHWLRHPLASGLPRKFKVAFSGCGKDCALAPIHDIGAVAMSRGGQRGFRLYVGGGLGTQPRRAEVLEEFVPAGDLFQACEAVLRVFARHFDRFLDRRNRGRARLKFLIERIGIDEFRKRWREEFDALDGFAPPPPDPPEEPPAPPPPVRHPAPAPRTREFARWVVFNAVEQKQEGYYSIFVLDLAGLALPGRGLVEDVTACPGASACPSAVTNSRALGKVLSERLAGKFDDLEDTTVKVCGCPNSCCRHAVASIALYGASRRVDGREVPHYVLMLGGGTEEGRVSFGKPVARVPAKRVPEAVEALLELYRKERRPGEEFREFAERLGAAG